METWAEGTGTAATSFADAVAIRIIAGARTLSPRTSPRSRGSPGHWSFNWVPQGDGDEVQAVYQLPCHSTIGQLHDFLDGAIPGARPVPTILGAPLVGACQISLDPPEQAASSHLRPRAGGGRAIRLPGPG